MSDSSSPPETPEPFSGDRAQIRPACQTALLTPPGRGAVATVLVVGPGSLTAIAPHFRAVGGRTADSFSDSRIIYGNWHRRRTDEKTGPDPPPSRAEDVVLVRYGPERIEIHCHGGALAAESILDDLVAEGCERTCGVDALVESQADPLAGQAIRQLVHAPTLRIAAILMDQVQGAFERSLRRIANHLRQQRLAVARGEIAELLANARVGLHLVQPWRVVLSGPPNVGKSSLINALVGYERAIVFAQPGTTRDVVRVATALDGWPIELSDTAGIRDSEDAIESEGIRRAFQSIHNADLVLRIQDASQPIDGDPCDGLSVEPARILHVDNKIDLRVCRSSETGKADRLPTSALSGEGIPELAAAIVERLVGPPPAAGAAVPITRQQVTFLQQAMDHCDQQQTSSALAIVDRLIPSVVAQTRGLSP